MEDALGEGGPRVNIIDMGSTIPRTPMPLSVGVAKPSQGEAQEGPQSLPQSKCGCEQRLETEVSSSSLKFRA